MIVNFIEEFLCSSCKQQITVFSLPSVAMKRLCKFYHLEAAREGILRDTVTGESASV